MDAQSIRENDASSDSSSASSSSSDTVLIAKPLNQKHRKKLQAQLQQDEHAPSLSLSARGALNDQSSSSSSATQAPVAAKVRLSVCPTAYDGALSLIHIHTRMRPIERLDLPCVRARRRAAPVLGAVRLGVPPRMSRHHDAASARRGVEVPELHEQHARVLPLQAPRRVCTRRCEWRTSASSQYQHQPEDRRAPARAQVPRALVRQVLPQRLHRQAPARAHRRRQLHLPRTCRSYWSHSYWSWPI